LNLLDNAAFVNGDRRVADALLKRFGIGHLGFRKPSQVSGGERQRCAVCQALARAPRALLLDEPFSALDFMARRLLRNEIKGLREILRVPIVYVTHDIHEAFSLADEILPLVEGKPDKNWLQRSIQAEPSTDKPSKAMRETRLALAL
jgi:molybdate transport system ATP-binding protein